MGCNNSKKGKNKVAKKEANVNRRRITQGKSKERRTRSAKRSSQVRTSLTPSITSNSTEEESSSVASSDWRVPTPVVPANLPTEEQLREEVSKRSATDDHQYEQMVSSAISTEDDQKSEIEEFVATGPLTSMAMVVDDCSERERILNEPSTGTKIKTPSPIITVIGLPGSKETKSASAFSNRIIIPAQKSLSDTNQPSKKRSSGTLANSKRGKSPKRARKSGSNRSSEATKRQSLLKPNLAASLKQAAVAEAVAKARQMIADKPSVIAKQSSSNSSILAKMEKLKEVVKQKRQNSSRRTLNSRTPKPSTKSCDQVAGSDGGTKKQAQTTGKSNAASREPSSRKKESLKKKRDSRKSRSTV